MWVLIMQTAGRGEGTLGGGFSILPWASGRIDYNPTHKEKQQALVHTHHTTLL